MDEKKKEELKKYVKDHVHDVCRSFFSDNVSEFHGASIEYVDSYYHRTTGKLIYMFHTKVLEFTEGDEISHDCYTDLDFNPALYEDTIKEQEIDIHIGENFELLGAEWA